MKKHTALEANGSDVGNGLQGTRLVVRMHHGYDGGLLANKTGQKLRVDDSIGVHRQNRYLKAFKMLQVLCGMEHGMVLDGGDDHMLAPHSMCASDTDETQVAGLRATAGKNNLMRLRPKKDGQTITGIIHCRPRDSSCGVNG